jgi:hypothetical protein
MNRTSFEFLYLHANAIADLGFLRAMAAAASAPPPELPPEQFAANAAEADRLMNPDAATFDWSAFEGVPGFDDTAGSTGDADTAVPADRGPTFDQALDQVGSTIEGDGPPELVPYLAQVHDARELLQARITACWEQAGPAFDALLLDLPPELAPITGPLTADTFLPWLERHEARDDGVQALVAQVRALDLP